MQSPRPRARPCARVPSLGTKRPLLSSTYPSTDRVDPALQSRLWSWQHEA